jgi:hydroxyethylthiazole kinase-like uncharacterized protein yjeF
MTELLTATQMRAIEAAAIASGEVTGLDLMERAGRGVVEAIFAEWPELATTSHRAVVLCGPGNNGGDGFVVARVLKDQGWEVKVFLSGDPERMPPDARVNHDRWVGMGEVGRLELDGFPQLHAVHTDLFVDALFGTGLARPIDGEAAKVLVHIRTATEPHERSMRSREHLVAIDVPSGLCSDSGKVLRGASQKLAHFRADLTVTFHRAKIGHVLENGPELVGKLVTMDIGLSGHAMVHARKVHLPGTVKPARVAGRVVRQSSAPRTVDIGKWSGHKYVHGHALILSGPFGHGGAARLAARGALRIGAGVVTVGCPTDALAEHAARLDAIMLRRVEDAADLAGMLEDRRINALCLGPGMGVLRAKTLLVVALKGAESLGKPRPAVLDADALTALAGEPALFAVLHGGCVLTPHAGEFARLFPDIAARLATPATTGPAYSKVDATRDAAVRAGCVVLFKGADTVIAAPDGRCSINAAVYDRTAPWLATAGSGDVLAGFITGLLARGLAPMQAAETAVWLHVECARSFGPGLIAEDLPNQLPTVFRALSI